MSEGLKLLSSIIANSSSGTLIRINDDLFNEAEVPAYDFMRGFYRQYHALPDAATVTSETGIRLPITNEPLQFYIDNVEERKTYNLIRDHFEDLRENLRTLNVEGMSADVEAMSRVTRRATRGRDVLQLNEAMNLVVERIERTRGYGGITGVETDMPRFDLITGGYQNSDLISYIARPGVGKTYLLLRQAQKAHAAGHSVLFVTTEMGLEQIARRYAALELGINPKYLKMSMLDTYTERRLRNLCTEMIAAERFKIFSVGMNSKVSAIEALIDEFRPDIVFIDGAYLLHPNTKQALKRIEKVGEVYDELKKLNLEADIPFVCTTQFNRQAGKDGKDGSLETIGFSDAIGTHSSIVVAIKYGPTEDIKRSRTLEFMKGREGESGGVSMHFQFAPNNFDEFTEEEEAQFAGSEGGSAAPGAAGAGAAAVDVNWMA